MARMRLPVAVASSAVLLAGAFAGLARADVTLPAVFSDRAVLQRDRPLAVWGWAAASEEVTVSLGARTAKTTTAADGRWRVDLDAQPAGGPFELVVQGRNRVVAKDVLVGEVWLASGQSNMAWTVAGTKDAEAERKAADFPQLRVFTTAMAAAGDPAADVKGAWAATSPDTVAGFSAVAWFFARDLHRTLGVPVGVVVSSVGGTVAEAWTPPEAVEKEPALAPMWAKAQKALAGWDRAAAEAKWRKAWRKWEAEAASDRRAGRTPPPEPTMPGDPRTNLLYPGSLWHGMVAPLVPLSLRGFLWYQGESNAPRAEQYVTLFPTLIRAWRAAWGRDDLPFYFVQLSSFGKVADSTEASTWAELRDAQALALGTVERTGMAVTIDVGDPADIHPKDKQTVGSRLARLALAKDYARADVVWSGPVLRSSRVEGNKVVLVFDHAEGLSTRDGREPSGFAVASAKGEFHPARATIEGDTVVVSSRGVAAPAAVRYAWADAPESANLVNGAGLPASPFRTDTRPRTTAGAH